MTEKTYASPACALTEAPDSYLGYWTPAEIAARLHGIADAARRSGAIVMAEQLMQIRQTLPAAEPVATDTTIAVALDSLLPKIRDDRLHAALLEIRTSLP